ncbi:MAG: hypothetical protein Q8912_05535 [Bacillota bacterium]|nr:hypothetical protein [Bacillota bacterium]
MDFDACSTCFYGQLNDICDAFMIRNYSCENGVTEISWNGGECPFYHEKH